MTAFFAFGDLDDTHHLCRRIFPDMHERGAR
jgi:hypothetical protein